MVYVWWPHMRPSALPKYKAIFSYKLMLLGASL